MQMYAKKIYFCQRFSIIMISRDTINKIYDSIRVEEVIGDFVQLKRAGANLKGLSPFSNEKTPSFVVSPSKQIWKDFSSGKGGNAIAFLMEHEHYNYVEALKYLATKYGIKVEETQTNEEDKIQASKRESMFLVNDFARDFFRETLSQSEEGKAIGLTYFKERGFTDETIEKFQLGYSPESWSALTEQALAQGYSLEYLQQVGLTIVKENGQKIDRFRARVIFPIHSMSGRILGFGGRTLSQEKKIAKYLNSPESDIYNKSKTLYGIFQAKQFISKHDNCFLVEGYTDVIQFYQKGIQNVVASSGTALTPEQIRLIHRLTPNITILYDGDSAGLRASLRGIDLILEQGMNVRICTFPQGEDPDSFARKNSYEQLTDYIEKNTNDFIKFKASLLADQTQNDPIKRAQMVGDMVASISKISDPIKREIYIRECSAIMQISEQALFSALAQISKNELRKVQKNLYPQSESPVVHKPLTINRLEVLEQELIKYLVLYGKELLEFDDIELHYDETGKETIHSVKNKMQVFEKFFLELQTDEIQLSTPVFQQIFQLISQRFQENPEFDVHQIINDIPLEISSVVASIYADDQKLQLHKWEEYKDIIPPEKNEPNQIARAVSAVILGIRSYLVSQKIKDLSQELSQQNDTEQKTIILKDIKDYILLQKTLNHRTRN